MTFPHWITQSRKAKIALGGIVLILLSHILPRLGFSAAEVADIGHSILTLAGLWIGGIAIEDGAEKLGSPYPFPSAREGDLPSESPGLLPPQGKNDTGASVLRPASTATEFSASPSSLPNPTTPKERP